MFQNVFWMTMIFALFVSLLHTPQKNKALSWLSDQVVEHVRSEELSVGIGMWSCWLSFFLFFVFSGYRICFIAQFCVKLWILCFNMESPGILDVHHPVWSDRGAFNSIPIEQLMSRGRLWLSPQCNGYSQGHIGSGKGMLLVASPVNVSMLFVQMRTFECVRITQSSYSKQLPNIHATPIISW